MGQKGVLPFWEMVLNLIKNIPCFLSNAPSWLQNSRLSQEVCDCVSPSHFRKVWNRDHTHSLLIGKRERDVTLPAGSASLQCISTEKETVNASALRKPQVSGDRRMTVAVVRSPLAWTHAAGLQLGFITLITKPRNWAWNAFADYSYQREHTYVSNLIGHWWSRSRSHLH